MQPAPTAKDELHRYLTQARQAVLWKVEGLDEYSARRPMTPTGTSVAGLVKHLAGVEIGYFGDAFGRPFPQPLPWIGELETDANADLWLRADETTAGVCDLYRRAIEHADATIAALPAQAVGHVPWWPAERADATLTRILTHMLAETARHAGHIDIVRELVDGAAGLRADRSNLAEGDAAFWAAYRARVEQAACDGARDDSAPAD